jgi:hypothetical protein
VHKCVRRQRPQFGYLLSNTPSSASAVQLDDIPDPDDTNRLVGILASLVTSHPDSQPSVLTPHDHLQISYDRL